MEKVKDDRQKGVQTVTGFAALPQAKIMTTGEVSPYVPVEWFKGQALNDVWPRPLGDIREFLSSGTSGQERSRSLFSVAGLKAYRQAAIQNFSAVLENLLPKMADVRNVEGISLIPPVAAWPDSSLAQMLEWFAAVWPVRYLSVSDFAALAPQLGDKPRWLFGTAAHWQQLAQTCNRLALPGENFVFETGGSKSLGEPLDRETFYQRLCNLLNIEPWQIVSEYGMSELAAQAYDWVIPELRGEQQVFSQRRYRFAKPVSVWVMKRAETMLREGVGALVVTDPARVDLPYPVRTQDLIDLDDDGGFVLHGRVPQADLRGCSLRVETIVGDTTTANAPAPLSAVARRMQPILELDVFLPRLRAFLQSSLCQLHLTRELGSASAAAAALEDLVACLPMDVSAFHRVIATAMSESALYKRWLMIAPASHSIAPIYPLVVGAIAGLDLTLRLPNLRGGLLEQVVGFIRESIGAEINMLPPSWRLRGSVAKEWDAILAFGSDATLAEIRARAGIPIAGYGDYLAASWVRDLNTTNVAKAVKDALSLGQKGCMSSRLLIVQGSTKPDRGQLHDFARLLQANAKTFWAMALSDSQRTALDHEFIRYRAMPEVYLAPVEDVDEILCPQIIVADAAALPGAIGRIFSSRSFVLPVVWFTSAVSDACLSALNATISVNPGIALLTVDELSRGEIAALTSVDSRIQLRALGDANRPPWDGSLQGAPLFACR